MLNSQSRKNYLIISQPSHKNKQTKTIQKTNKFIKKKTFEHHHCKISGNFSTISIEIKFHKNLCYSPVESVGSHSGSGSIDCEI